MATVDFDDRGLRVRFSAVERLATWRSEVSIPLAAVRAVEVLDSPLAHTRGGRMGFLVSGLLKVGIWGVGTGRRQLVSIRRSTPALRVELDRVAAGATFDEVLVSTSRAAEIAATLKTRAAGKG